MRKHPSRARRRAALLALLALLSPAATASGDPPSREPASWMPPLPLDSAGPVQSNPFCQPPGPSPAAGHDPAVQLTSGEPPLVHLKPAGSAVGLVPIGESTDAASDASTRSSSARVDETAPPARVQTNPWAKAEPRTTPKPIKTKPTRASDAESEMTADAEAADAKEAISFSLSDQASSDSPHQQSNAVSRADDRVASGGWQSARENQQAEIGTTVTEAAELAPGRARNLTLDSETAPSGETALGKWRAPALSATAESAAAPEKRLAEPVAPAEPAAAPSESTPPEPAKIVSSGSQSLPEPTPSSSAAGEDETADQPKIISPRPALVQEAEPIVMSGPASEPAEPTTAESKEAESKEAALAQSRARSESPRVAAAPSRQTQPARSHAANHEQRRRRREIPQRLAAEPRGVALKAEGKKSSQTSISAALRHRPPVAIAAPPLAVERPADGPVAAIVRPTVKTVAATELDDANAGISPRRAGASRTVEPSSPAPSDSKRPRLHLRAAQVRSLTIGGTLRRVQVADDRICQAIAAGDSEVKVIGVSDGVTQLSVWAQAAGGGSVRHQVFQVRVGGAVESAGQSLSDTVRMLNQSIADAFPKAQVTVRPLRNRLIVSGHCTNKDSATEILRMVRKTCLVPVRDELVIR